MHSKLCCRSASLLLAAACVAWPAVSQAALPVGATASPAVAPPTGSDSYQAGWADRLHWEEWFSRQAGDARTGALWWSAERSKPAPAACQGSPAFVSGCLDAKAILTPMDSRRHREPDYKTGWNSFAPDQSGQTTAPAALPEPERLAPRGDAGAWSDGLHDRTAWEDWFATLEGDRRAGALFWSAERGKPNPAGCDGGTPDLVAGCQEAQRRLAQPDHRRHSEADYWRGWNSYRLGPAPPQARPAEDRPPSPAAAASAGQCADFGTLGRLCTGQDEAAVVAAFGDPAAHALHRCAVGTPAEADCQAWFYVHDCGRYTILFERAGSGNWRITAAGFTKAATPAETAQWCDARG